MTKLTLDVLYYGYGGEDINKDIKRQRGIINNTQQRAIILKNCYLAIIREDELNRSLTGTMRKGTHKLMVFSDRLLDVQGIIEINGNVDVPGTEGEKYMIVSIDSDRRRTTKFSTYILKRQQDEVR